MTPPTRHQRIAFLVLVCLSVLLLSIDASGRAFDGVRSNVQEAFGPVQTSVTDLVEPIRNYASDLTDLRSAQREAASLREENAELTRDLAQARQNTATAGQLNVLDSLSRRGQFDYVPAQVVSLAPGLGFDWTATINAGSADGIKEEMTVVSPDGLAGRVIQVSRSTSVVLLITDPGFTVGVRQEGTDKLGLATGNGTDPMQFEPLDAKAKLKKGDRLITGPYGGTTFVPSVPVGEFTDVEEGESKAKIRLFADIASLDVVGVLVSQPASDPGDSVLTPRAEE